MASGWCWSVIRAAGSFGVESGRNFLRIGAVNNWDAALSKEFSFKERIRIEACLDAFNALNHTQFDGVFDTLNVARWYRGHHPIRQRLRPSRIASRAN